MREEDAASGVPTPHEGQEKVLALPGRFRIAVCGRRFGKTVLAAVAAIDHCRKNSEAQRVWWISPVQEQSDRVEREIAGWLSGCLKQNKKTSEERASNHVIEWEHRRQEHALVYGGNGSRIEFHTAHVPDRLRGAGLDLVIVDEAADVSEYTWKMVIKPMLLEKQGRALITGTPRGKQHWLHRVFLLGQAEEHRAMYSSLQLPSRANPRLPQEDLEGYRVEMTEDQFRQEFEAEFLDAADSVFTRVEEAQTAEQLDKGRSGETYITGIDLGDKHDFTVLCSVGCRGEKLEGFARFNNLGWHEQILRIREHLRKFPGPCVVDATGLGDPVFQMLWQDLKGRVTPYKFTGESKENLVRGLQYAFDAKELRIPKLEVLVNELNAFTRLNRENRNDRYMRYGAPTGLHDDCVIALGLAWYGLKRGGLWAAGPTGNALQEGLYA